MYNKTYSTLVIQRINKYVVLCSIASWHIDLGETSNYHLPNNCNPCLTSPSVLTMAIISNDLFYKTVFTTCLKIYLFKNTIVDTLLPSAAEHPKMGGQPLIILCGILKSQLANSFNKRVLLMPKTIFSRKC